jgi:hypothetical protein
LSGKLSLLAVFAHPDDETFRPGGTLALLARHGVRVEVLTFTHGEAGSCGDPPLCTSAELPAVREHELRSAWLARRFVPKLERPAAIGLWGMAIFTVIFLLYLTYLEPFVIKAV